MGVGNSGDNYNQVASHFNCTAGATLGCLRAVPAQDILNYIVNQTLLFYPVEDNATSVGKSANVEIKSGQFASVPILIGTNSQEFNAFSSILGVNTTGSQAQYVTDIHAQLSCCPLLILIQSPDRPRVHLPNSTPVQRHRERRPPASLALPLQGRIPER